MVPGTVKISSKSGPVDFLAITKMLQKIQENLRNHPGQILFLSNWGLKKVEQFREHVCPRYKVFHFRLAFCEN